MLLSAYLQYMFAGKQGRIFLTSMGMSTLLSYSKLVCELQCHPHVPGGFCHP